MGLRWIPVLVAALLTLCGTPALAAGTPQEEGKETKKTATWKVQILGTSRPSSVLLKSRSRYGGTEDAKDTPAPEGKRWVVIRAKVTPPSVGASLTPDAIRITDTKGDIHAGLALTHIPADGTKPSFLYFEDSEGLAFMSADGKINWLTAYGKVSFQTVQPPKIALLFTLPPSAVPAFLEIGDSGKIALPKGK